MKSKWNKKRKIISTMIVLFVLIFISLISFDIISSKEIIEFFYKQSLKLILV